MPNDPDYFARLPGGPSPEILTPRVYASQDIVAPPEGDEDVQVNYFELLWRQKLLVGAVLIVGAFGGFVSVVMQPPLYRSTVTLEILGFNESFMGMNQVDPQAGTGNYSATGANVETQTRILTSKSLLNRVNERLNLELTPMSSVPPDLFSKLRDRLGLIPREPVEILRQAIQSAAGSVSARGVGASRLLQITAESTSPEIAASFVNTLASEYMSQNLQLRSSTTVQTMQWLEGQLEEARSRMQQAESRLQEFIRSTGIEFAGQQSTLDHSKLAQLQAELSAIQADRIAKESRYKIAKSSPIDSLPDILDDGRLKGLRDTLTGLRRERAQLLATVTPNHYTTQRVQAQIDEIEQTLQTEKANLVRRIQNEYEAALQQERLLSQGYQQQSRTVAGEIDKAAEYGALRREAEMARQAHDALLQQLNQVTVVSAVPANNIRIVDPAAPAGEPSKPKPAQNIAFGAFLCSGLVYGLAYLLEWRRLSRLSEVFASPGHTSDLLRLPELGVIPSVGSMLPRPRALFRRTKSGDLKFFMNRNGERREASLELVTWRKKPSALAESFRYTLTSLLGGRDEQWRPLIVVTSAGPGEGKTTIASNLAIAMAETGRRVLLIDADLRKPRLHKIFGIPEDRGLADLLIDNGVQAAQLLDYVHSTEVPGLFLLVRGAQMLEAASQHFFSRRISWLLRALQREFDAILIDSAPALTLPDARLLGRLSDGVVLVVRAGATHRKAALTLRRQFASDGILVLGTVLNDWNPDASEKYYAAEYSTHNAG